MYSLYHDLHLYISSIHSLSLLLPSLVPILSFLVLHSGWIWVQTVTGLGTRWCHNASLRAFHIAYTSDANAVFTNVLLLSTLTPLFSLLHMPCTVVFCIPIFKHFSTANIQAVENWHSKNRYSIIPGSLSHIAHFVSWIIHMLCILNLVSSLLCPTN